MKHFCGRDISFVSRYTGTCLIVRSSFAAMSSSSDSEFEGYLED